MNIFGKIFFSTVLVTALLGSTVAFASSFTDVNKDKWYADIVQWGSDNAIAAGYEDGTFRPNNPVTEEEFLTLMIKAFSGGKSLEVATGERWSEPYYAIAKANNYPTSKSRATKINRQYVAEVITGTQGKNFSGNDAIRYMLSAGLANGKTSNTVAGFAGKDFLTRAEALQFIRNVLTNADSKKLLVRPAKPTPKTELPSLEIPADNIVGAVDAELAKLANELNAAVSGYGFVAGYNGDFGTVFMKDEEGFIRMSYSDGRDTADGTVVVNLSGMIDSSTKKVDGNKLDAVLISMDIFGLPADSEMRMAIEKVASVGGQETTILHDGITIDIFKVGLGKVVLYIDIK